MTLTRWRPLWDLEKWQPVREIESLQHEMNRMFEQLMHGGNGGLKDLTFIPSVEMEDTADEIRLKLEVPGMEAKDLDIEVMEDAVKIKGERKAESKTEEKGMVRSEFHYGSFERIVPLPSHVQSEKANAEYKHGILSLTLPKSEEEKRKIVKINVS
ncbi:MAG: Hsp20/alpha crystallin family protein [Thermosynechococcaceae cyanobacterium]